MNLNSHLPTLCLAYRTWVATHSLKVNGFIAIMIYCNSITLFLISVLGTDNRFMFSNYVQYNTCIDVCCTGLESPCAMWLTLGWPYSLPHMLGFLCRLGYIFYRCPWLVNNERMNRRLSPSTWLFGLYRSETLLNCDFQSIPLSSPVSFWSPKCLSTKRNGLESGLDCYINRN